MCSVLVEYVTTGGSRCLGGFDVTVYKPMSVTKSLSVQSVPSLV